MVQTILITIGATMIILGLWMMLYNASQDHIDEYLGSFGFIISIIGAILIRLVMDNM